MALMRKLLTTCLLFAAAPAFAQQQVVPGLVLPPQSLIGNNLPLTGNAVAVSYPELKASLVGLGLMTAPTIATQGNACVFGSVPGVVLDAGAPPMLLAPVPAYTLKGNATGSAAVPSDISIPSLTQKPVPVAGDIVLIQDSAAGNAFKRTTVGAIGTLGTVSSIDSQTGVFTTGGGLKSTGQVIQRALTEALVQGTPTIGGGVGTTLVMQGFGSTCKLTPAFSTRVRFHFDADVSNNTAATATNYNFRYGTGAAPAFNAAASGTAGLGNTMVVNHPTANANLHISLDGIITGLVAGTNYWFDMTINSSSNTSILSVVNCNAQEL
jgi:hypothetical protein